jgi:hypothetical protein
MGAVMVPRRAHGVPPRRPATDRQDLRPLARRVIAGPRALLAPRVVDLDRGGIDDGPILHPTERARQLDRRRPRRRQSPRRPRRPEPLARRGAPPLARGARDAWHFRRQGGAQDVGLISAARRPGRHDPRAPQHREVQLARSRDHATRLAPVVQLILRQHLLAHGTDRFPCQVLSPLRLPVLRCLLWPRSARRRTRNQLAVKGHNIAIT